jgi:hypothetical protein
VRGDPRFDSISPFSGEPMIDLTALPKTIEEWNRRVWEAGDQLIPMTVSLQMMGKRRKLRLFTLACFDIVRPHVTDPRSLAAVAFFEHHIEKSGVFGRTGRPAVAETAEVAATEIRNRFNIYGGVAITTKQWDDTIAHAAAAQLVAHKDSEAANMCGQFAAQIRLSEWAFANGYWPPDWTAPEVNAAWTARQKEIINLLKDVVGDPFRPVTFNPSWRTSDVMLLAQGIYDDRAFDRMPILADALQDAGCENEDILSHARDATATHVRGCWVVDLVLGKA